MVADGKGSRKINFTFLRYALYQAALIDMVYSQKNLELAWERVEKLSP
jgi:hypothetical protein